MNTNILNRQNTDAVPRRRGRPKKLASTNVKSVSYPTYQNILDRPTRVLVERRTLEIALVEANTNIIQTRAVLLLHLFQTRKAACIFCPECNKHMSVIEFGSHFHLDSFDDEKNQSNEMKEKRRRELEALKRKSYNTLPCPDPGQTELTSQQAEKWAKFLQLTVKFQVFPPPAQLDRSM